MPPCVGSGCRQIKVASGRVIQRQGQLPDQRQAVSRVQREGGADPPGRAVLARKIRAASAWTPSIIGVTSASALRGRHGKEAVAGPPARGVPMPPITLIAAEPAEG